LLAMCIARPVLPGGDWGWICVHRRGGFVPGGDCRELRRCVADGCRPAAEKLQRPRSRTR